MRQQNSDAVEDFILPYSAVYLRIQKWKNDWNRSTFAKVIVKIKVARFLWPTVYSRRFSWCSWNVTRFVQAPIGLQYRPCKSMAVCELTAILNVHHFFLEGYIIVMKMKCDYL